MNQLEGVTTVKNLILEVESIGKKLKEKIHLEDKKEEDRLKHMFYQTFINTATTTVEYLENKDVFLITGDINAMWLRDSSCQVIPYIKFANEYTEIRNCIKALIKKQFEYIEIDGYANAFMKDITCTSRHKNDITHSTEWNWERKYEIDSLCYPIWLLQEYYNITKDRSVFTKQIQDVCYRIVHLWEVEQHHSSQSDYFFERKEGRATDTLINQGKGAQVSYTGMTWSGFRPSDDACTYGYLIPANMFASVVLSYVEEFAKDIYEDMELQRLARERNNEIKKGIQEYGIYHHESYGEIYAYETDGLGNYNLMDDANVPSLLSIPWLGYCSAEDEIYQNTRRFILSKDNPYFYEGTVASGIGSPHTPKDYIWHIALTMQGLTSLSQEERRRMLSYLMNSDGETGYMHEGFHCDRPSEYTRSWFAWANSLFAYFIMDLYDMD